MLRVTAEFLAIDSKRPQRAYAGGEPHAGETQLQLSTRVFF